MSITVVVNYHALPKMRPTPLPKHEIPAIHLHILELDTLTGIFPHSWNSIAFKPALSIPRTSCSTGNIKWGKTSSQNAISTYRTLGSTKRFEQMADQAQLSTCPELQSSFCLFITLSRPPYAFIGDSSSAKLGVRFICYKAHESTALGAKLFKWANSVVTSNERVVLFKKWANIFGR